MGMRFRKSFKLGGARVNISKSGSKKTKREATVTAADSYRFASIVFKVISIPMILFSGLLAFVYPVALLGIAIGIGEWKLGKLFKKKAEVIKNDRTI